MRGLAAVLAGRGPGGVLRWSSDLSVDGFSALVRATGWSVRHLDGAYAGTREEFLTTVGQALGFPATYGRNFDALADLLRDVAPTGAGPGTIVPGTMLPGTILLWDDWSVFAANDPHWFSVALDVLTERTEETGLPAFVVLLRGEGPEASQIPFLG